MLSEYKAEITARRQQQEERVAKARVKREKDRAENEVI